MKYCISRRMGQAGFFFFFSKTKKGPCPRIAWILHPFETETKKVKKRKEVKILTVIIELLDVLRWWCSDLLIRKFFESRMKVFIFIKIFTSSNQSLWGESLVCGYCCSRWRLQSDDVHTHTHTDSERERLGWTVTRLVRLSGYHWLISRVASALERNEEERMTCGELRWIGRSKLLSGYRSRSRLQTDLASRLSIRMSEMVSWGDRVTSSSF